jgi:arabinofuranosyltransferase
MSTRTRNILGWLAASIVLTIQAYPSIMTLVDDAYISARYAMNLAAGEGLVYTFGEPPIEGVTNLCWTALLAIGLLLNLPIAELMAGLGLIFGWLTIACAIGLTQALVDRDSPWPLLAGAVIALSPHLAVATTNGLETSMFISAVLGMCWLTLQAEGKSRGLIGVGAGLLGLIRPEGWAVGGLCFLYDFWTHGRSGSWSNRLRAFVPFAGIVVAVTLFRLGYFGAILPNTFSAKADAPFQSIWKNNIRYVTPDLLMWTSSSAAALVSCLMPGARAKRLLVVGVGASLVVISFQVTLWMPGARLLIPSYALFVCAFIGGASQLPKQRLRWLAIGGLSALLVSASLYNLKRVRGYDSRHSVLPGNPAERAATHLRTHAERGNWLATRDAGVFAYFVGANVRVAELHSRALTRPHPEGKAVRVADYTPKNPAFIVSTVARKQATDFRYSNDRLVFNRADQPYRYLGRVEQHYHRYYDIYVRSDLKIPPLDPALVLNRLGPKPGARKKQGKK